MYQYTKADITMSHDVEVSNPSKNRHFGSVLQANLCRRKVLAGGLAMAAAGFFAGTGSAFAGQLGLRTSHQATGQWRKHDLLSFKPVSNIAGKGPWPTISEARRSD